MYYYMLSISFTSAPVFLLGKLILSVENCHYTLFSVLISVSCLSDVV